jgi:hypothetical protein
MQRTERALGGADGAGDAGGREASAFEPGPHRSVYERAFGPLGDVGFDHGRVPAPWPQHSDLLDEHEQEEMLYRRQMALAAQDRARCVPLPTWLCRGSSARSPAVGGRAGYEAVWAREGAFVAGRVLEAYFPARRTLH